MNREHFDTTGVTVVEYSAALGQPQVEFDLNSNRGRVDSIQPIAVKRRFWRPSIVQIRPRHAGGSSRGGTVQRIENSVIGGGVSQISNVGGNVTIGRGGDVGQPAQDAPHPFVIHFATDARDKISIRAI